MSWAILNVPFPLVSQHVPPRSDVENELCGPACCCMAVGYVYGTDRMPTAHEASAAMHSNGLVTSAKQLAAYLTTWSIASAIAPEITDQNKLLWTCWDALKNGHVLLIAQRYSATVLTNHWRVVVGLTPTSVWLADPWNGTLIAQTYQDFFTLFAAAAENRALITITTGRT